MMRGLFRLLTLAVALAGAGCATPWRPEPLVSEFGIGHLIHPVEPPERIPCPPAVANGTAVCQPERVHVFAINGLNPLCLGNFNGMCGYLRERGFVNTHFGQPYTCFWFPDEIREVRARDPRAKIVLVGFSWGANIARSMAHRLGDEGITVDLLVYLVGDTIWNTDYSHPPNVRRIVNVRGRGLVLLGGLCDGAELDGARNEYIDCRHILAPSRPETIALMMEELLALACTPVRPRSVPFASLGRPVVNK